MPPIESPCSGLRMRGSVLAKDKKPTPYLLDLFRNAHKLDVAEPDIGCGGV